MTEPSGIPGAVQVAKPAGVVVGDVMLASVVADGGTGVTVSASAGWTLVKTQSSSTVVQAAVFQKVATAAEPVSFVFTLSVAKKVTASISAYSGVDMTTPIDVAATASTSTSGTVKSAPTITTAGSYRQVVAVYGVKASTSLTPASGLVERVDANSTGTGGVTLGVDDRNVAGVGGSGVSTVTAAVAGVGVQVSVALRPAVVSRTDRTSYSASGDTGDVTLTTSNVVTERFVPLPGGVLVTKRAGGDVWSYPNVHGDIVATTNAAGVKQGVTAVYDPYGTVVTGVVADNAAGAFDFGWVGQHQRPVETETGTQPLIEMGARGYNPTLGRFLETDPIEGGNANDYIYPGDPINMFDLDGLSGGGGGNAGASQRQAQECKKNANTFSCPWTGSGGSWNPLRWISRSFSRNMMALFRGSQAYAGSKRAPSMPLTGVPQQVRPIVAAANSPGFVSATRCVLAVIQLQTLAISMTVRIPTTFGERAWEQLTKKVAGLGNAHGPSIGAC